MAQRAVLTPKNSDVDSFNELCLSRIPGNVVDCKSIDAVAHEDNPTLYPTEFLNSLNVSGLPSHVLKLKVNCPVILLRNLDPRNGACNGTRMILNRITRRLLLATIIQGMHAGKTLMIPRIKLHSSSNQFPFILTRLQFPVRLAFAMTINKAQGQTLGRVGVYLPQPVFGHGQLYVALSRVGSADDVTVMIKNTETQGQFDDVEGWYTRNIVYTGALT